jgi:single-strand DNA-binding protein
MAMSQDNHITLRGFVTAEPKFRQTAQTRTAVTEIRVGSTPRRLNRDTGEWQDAETSYYTVKCWRRLAFNIVGSLHKGDMVIVRGKFYQNSWLDKETQRPRTSIEIEADSIGHDLTYGHAIFRRTANPQPEISAAVNAGEMSRQDIGLPGDPSDDDDEGAYRDVQATPVRDGDGNGGGGDGDGEGVREGDGDGYGEGVREGDGEPSGDRQQSPDGVLADPFAPRAASEPAAQDAVAVPF